MIKNFVEIALCSTVLEILAFCVLQFLRKNLKIKNGRHFCQDNISLKIGVATLQTYPVGQKFHRNRSI